MRPVPGAAQRHESRTAQPSEHNCSAHRRAMAAGGVSMAHCARLTHSETNLIVFLVEMENETGLFVSCSPATSLTFGGLNGNRH